MLQYELIRVYRNKLLYLSIVIGTITGLSGLIPFYRHPIYDTNISGSISCYDAWLYCLSLGRGTVYRFVMPLLVCLPFVDSYLNDFRSRRLNFILLRNSYTKYFHAKTIAVALSAASVVLGILSMWFFIAMLLFPHTSSTSDFSYIPKGPFDYLYKIHPLSYVSVIVSLNVISGIFYALIGLGATLFFRNKIFVLCAPLVLYIGQIIIAYLLPFSTHIFSPINMITPYESETYSYVSLVLSFLFLALLSIILLFKLKLKDGKEYL